MADIINHSLDTLSVDIAMIRVGHKTMSRSIFNQIPLQVPEYYRFEETETKNHIGRTIINSKLILDYDKFWENSLGFVMTIDKKFNNEYYKVVWIWNRMLRVFNVGVNANKDMVTSISVDRYQSYFPCAPHPMKQLFLSA